MDLTEWAGYLGSKGGYRHVDQAVVGWVDGHVKGHRQEFVSRTAEEEDGTHLFGNDRYVYWNLR